MERRLFALDQNFPEPIVLAIMKAVPVAELVPLRMIDPKLAEVDDWELLLALHQDQRPWDGLITNDDAMLSLAKDVRGDRAIWLRRFDSFRRRSRDCKGDCRPAGRPPPRRCSRECRADRKPRLRVTATWHPLAQHRA